MDGDDGAGRGASDRRTYEQGHPVHHLQCAEPALEHIIQRRPTHPHPSHDKTAVMSKYHHQSI